MNKRVIVLFLMALMCAIAAPSFAALPPVLTTVPTPTGQSDTASLEPSLEPSLEQQSRTLYESGQVEQAIVLLQQAIATYQSQGDELRRAIGLSNLALLYQQLGAWADANTAIQTSLTLLAAPYQPPASFRPSSSPGHPGAIAVGPRTGRVGVGFMATGSAALSPT